jgi:uncharacterized repeat protein (TIGR01451 family)
LISVLLGLIVGPATSLPGDPAHGLADHAQGTILAGLNDLSMAGTRVAGLDAVATIPALDVALLSVPADQEMDTLETLRRNPAVTFAELDYAAYAAEGITPNDPGWVHQWGPQTIHAPEAWLVSQGSPGVVIAVLDSGVTLGHPDLNDQLWVNPGEVPANGIDDDGNSKVDDVWGWHFYQMYDEQVQAYVPRENNQIADDNGHGTHVAGIAGAEMDNGLGIAGVAPASRLLIVKVLDQYGNGWYSDIAQGIVYAVENGASIVNLSLGGAAPSETLQAAVDYAHSRGVLVVAAAGNSGGPVLYPAACEDVLAVAATDVHDQHASFSNYGPEVDVAAPGVDIYSTWPWRDGYWTLSGTSTASPHVAGLAALIRSFDDALGPDQVAQVLARTAVDVHAAGWDPYTGWGRIDAQAAMRYLQGDSLNLHKAVDAPRLGAAGPVTYTITATNEGQILGGIVLTDALPAEVQLLSADPPGSYEPATHELVWAPLTATTGAWFTATVVVTTTVAELPPCALISNTVYLAHDGRSAALQATASHRARACYTYFPIISKGR